MGQGRYQLWLLVAGSNVGRRSGAAKDGWRRGGAEKQESEGKQIMERERGRGEKSDKEGCTGELRNKMWKCKEGRRKEGWQEEVR